MKNNIKKPNIVIAGDGVVAGVDYEDCNEIPNAVVVQFDSREQMQEVLSSRLMEFDMFRRDDEEGSDS